MQASETEQKASAPDSHPARRHPRYQFRKLAVATIYPPAGEEEFRPPQICYVHTKDLSKGGISFLHPVPLFQSQRVGLRFLDGSAVTMAIKWIKRVDRDCYMMGCEFATG